MKPHLLKSKTTSLSQSNHQPQLGFQTKVSALALLDSKITSSPDSDATAWADKRQGTQEIADLIIRWYLLMIQAINQLSLVVFSYYLQKTSQVVIKLVTVDSKRNLQQFHPLNGPRKNLSI